MLTARYDSVAARPHATHARCAQRVSVAILATGGSASNPRVVQPSVIEHRGHHHARDLAEAIDDNIVGTGRPSPGGRGRRVLTDRWDGVHNLGRCVDNAQPVIVKMPTRAVVWVVVSLLRASNTTSNEDGWAVWAVSGSEQTAVIYVPGASDAHVQDHLSQVRTKCSHRNPSTSPYARMSRAAPPARPTSPRSRQHTPTGAHHHACLPGCVLCSCS